MELLSKLLQTRLISLIGTVTDPAGDLLRTPSGLLGIADTNGAESVTAAVSL